MELSALKETYSVLKLPPESPIPAWACQKGELFSVSGTEEELSIVCPTSHIPTDSLEDDHLEMVTENNWKCIKVEGVLDFSLTGILSSLSSALAKHGISLFAVSTYNTDYLLVKESVLEQAIAVLQREGHQFIDR